MEALTVNQLIDKLIKMSKSGLGDKPVMQCIQQVRKGEIEYCFVHLNDDEVAYQKDLTLQPPVLHSVHTEAVVIGFIPTVD